MEYFLRQIEPGVVSSPFTVDLTSVSYVFGRNRKCMGYQKLKKYPQVTEHHACFVRKENDWYIADMGSPDGTYLNYRRLDSFILKKLDIGDHIGLGAREVADGFVCAFSVKCPPIVRIKTEIKETEPYVQVDSEVVSSVLKNPRTESCEKRISSDEPMTKKIKTELLEVVYAESVFEVKSEDIKIDSVTNRIRRDTDSFEQILRNIPHKDQVVTRSSQKRDDWTKKPIQLTASCFKIPCKKEDDACGDYSSETEEVLHRIEKIRQSLQSKGRITFSSNSSF